MHELPSQDTNIEPPLYERKAHAIAETAAILNLNTELLQKNFATIVRSGQLEEVTDYDDELVAEAAFQTCNAQKHGVFVTSNGNTVEVWKSNTVEQAIFFARICGTYYTVDEEQGTTQEIEVAKMLIRTPAISKEETMPHEIHAQVSPYEGDLGELKCQRFIAESAELSLVIPDTQEAFDDAFLHRDTYTELPADYIEPIGIESLRPILTTEFLMRVAGSTPGEAAGEFVDPARCAEKFIRYFEQLDITQNPFLAISVAKQVTQHAVGTLTEALQKYDLSDSQAFDDHTIRRMLPTFDRSFIQAMLTIFAESETTVVSSPESGSILSTSHIPLSDMLRIETAQENNAEGTLTRNIIRFAYTHDGTERDLCFVQTPHIAPTYRGSLIISPHATKSHMDIVGEGMVPPCIYNDEST